MEPCPYWKKITIYRINAIVLNKREKKTKQNKREKNKIVVQEKENLPRYG